MITIIFPVKVSYVCNAVVQQLVLQILSGLKTCKLGSIFVLFVAQAT